MYLKYNLYTCAVGVGSTPSYTVVATFTKKCTSKDYDNIITSIPAFPLITLQQTLLITKAIHALPHFFHR